MSKDRDKSLRQRAIEAYRIGFVCDTNKVKRQFQKTFAVEPDHVSSLDSDYVLIRVDGLLIKSWLTESKKRWYKLVTKCLDCETVLISSSGTGRAYFEDLIGLGRALEALGEDYKTEIVCSNCAYRH